MENKVFIKKNRWDRFNNHILFFMCLSVFMLILSGCKSDDTTKEDENNQEEVCMNSNAIGYRTLQSGDQTREYILHVPSSIDNNTPAPLLINFHGFGGCAADFVTNVGEGASGLNAVAESNNFLIAYPQGVVRSKGSTEWDPGDNGTQNISDNDIYFVEQLIAEISAEFNVDSKHIYASGYSNGGMMAYGLACTKSDQIAAIGIMSGIMLAGDCDEMEYTSVIHFHGTDDGVLPLEGNQDFQAVSTVVNFWLDHNNIPATNLTSTALNNGDVTLDEYSGGNGNTSFSLYTIDRENDKPGGHVWFTGDINNVNPNQILWDFLSSYSLDD